ncbi:GTPase ObgE [candidate division WS5 bacterium]|uniref:GTPase Obg n=1 Tax=candidate division WS5 bacterium TaxID=2093353 RepID=A0A419DG32_9BACT|nr:MAG: GTPase ObgE [candidate division WS5 bacterium]
MFCDKVTIRLTAGKGGNGMVSFLHEKYREKGGPDGGDGGDGGSIYIVTDSSTNTLYEYKTKRHLKAENGENGKRRKKVGAGGKDLYIKVPVGTVVYNDETGEKIFDLTGEKQAVLVARGGEGGYGNAHFVSSVRQAPQVAELGEKGEERIVRLELKLIADVGLVGLPNVGKSTLLSVVSAAKPKIADYPFTTLVPNLGVVDGSKFGIENFSFVIADIPGLIEGASQGKGLGDEFLRHVERTRVLVHLIESTSKDFIKDFNDINKELEIFNKDIVKKPQIIAISKADLSQDFSGNLKKFKAHLKKIKGLKVANQEPVVISSPMHKGIKELMSFVAQTLQKYQPKPVILACPESEKDYKVFTPEDLVGDRFSVTKEDDKFIVSGKKIERFARKTDFGNSHSVARLKDIMKKTGIMKELERQGAESGGEVEISEKKFKL